MSYTKVIVGPTKLEKKQCYDPLITKIMDIIFLVYQSIKITYVT